MASDLANKIDPQNDRLKINNYLQVEEYTNIFAVGDIPNKEDKMAYFAGNQAEYVISLIRIIEEKKLHSKQYQASQYPSMLVTVGRKSGVSQLLTEGGFIIGDALAKFLKSKEFMKASTRSMSNYKTQSSDEVHQRNT
ncbi:unnamed protein product [Adineta ricciae]|uniref:FAD/NAD(P)-binding domain-containing protein n=1 Tax=Adineta ricciae TaxID=249248 RepID=A0A816DMY3_ADIRI|nr:unnamed protein product [Adineta ricciae]CAF1636236.1 unnamed protein product [Adineta ricciae]